MLQKEILNFFRAARLKAGNWTSRVDQGLLKSEKWQCWEERGRLKASVGISGRRGWDEVAALSVQAPWQRVHAHSAATLIKLSIRHSERGTGSETISFHKRKARPSYVRERREEKMHEGHFSLLRAILFLNQFFQQLQVMCWVRLVKAFCPPCLQLKKKSHYFHNMAKSQWWTGTRYLRCWWWRCSTATGISWLLGDDPN